MAKAKAKGTKSGNPIGRPMVSSGVEDRIRALRTEGLGMLKIAKAAGCRRPKQSRVFRTLCDGRRRCRFQFIVSLLTFHRGTDDHFIMSPGARMPRAPSRFVIALGRADGDRLKRLFARLCQVELVETLEAVVMASTSDVGGR